MEAEAKEREEKRRIKEERKRKREEDEKNNPSKPKVKDGATKKNKKLANCNILSAEDKMNAMMAKLMGGSV